MQLERASARLRPRTAVEAVDLGLRMAWHWWPKLIWAWLIVLLPVALLSLTIFQTHPLWGLALIWWLKPACDAVLLDAYSKALFGSTISTRSILLSAPKVWRRHWLSLLTLSRLDHRRPISMPVLQLEGTTGRAFWARRNLLAKATGIEVSRLSFIFLCFELSIALAPPWLVLMFESDYSTTSSAFDISINYLLASRLWVGCYLLAVAVLEPFFVAAGFSLYVNRRTHLEGWDIELAFRRMQRRLEQYTSTLVIAFALLGTGFAIAAPSDTIPEVDALHPDAATDQVDLGADMEWTSDVIVETREDPKQVVEEVLSSEDFGGERQAMRWRRVRSGSSSAGSLTPFGLSLATAIEPFLWILAIVAISLLIFWIVIKLDTAELPASVPLGKPFPTVVMGMDVREEALPDDVPAEAKRLWSDGRHREALQLLYRASISRLMTQDRVEIKDSATEHDVLTAAASIAKDRYRYFRSLTVTWQKTAYGHQIPEKQDSELIDSWRTHFEETP